MAHVLICHPNDAVRLALRRAIEPAGHVVEHLGDAGEVVGLVEHQEAIQDPFDVLLLPDPALLASLGARRVDHGVALVGASAPEPFLGAVDPGAPADGIVAQLGAVLGRRERYLERLATWDLALGRVDKHELQTKMLRDAAAVEGAERVYWYSLIDLDPAREAIEGFHVDENEYHMGLATSDGARKEAFNALKDLIAPADIRVASVGRRKAARKDPSSVRAPACTAKP